MLATRTIGVRLNIDELEALRAVADREDRDPRRQAARLLRESLERAGALSTDDKRLTTGSPDPVTAA
jgi:hypothetical protein